jgi:hypothetical protein
VRVISLGGRMVSIVIAADSPSSWSIGDYGSVAALISILGFVLAVLLAGRRRWRQWRHSVKLSDWLNHAEELNTAFVGYQVHTSEQLPSNCVTGDSGLDERLAHLRAQVRGLRTDVVLERARDDIERALSIIGETSALYANGTLTWKAPDAQRSESEDHFSPVLALGPEDGAFSSETMKRKRTVEELRREFELRVRTARYQLYPGRLRRWSRRFRGQETKEPKEFVAHWAVFQWNLDESKKYLNGRRSELEEVSKYWIDGGCQAQEAQ